MKLYLNTKFSGAALAFCALGVAGVCAAAEKLTGINSSMVMSQCLPYLAQEAGLFRKHNLDFQLVYISSSGMVTAALLAGESEVALTGAVGLVRAFAQGSADFVFIGSNKNILTHSIIAKPDLKRPEDIKGKKIGVTRIGSNTHYFTVQVLRRLALDPMRDVTFIQTGGATENLAALLNGSIDAAAMTAPADAQAVARGYRYLIHGQDFRLPYAAASFATRRSLVAKRPQAIGQFMRAMAEAAKILHTDKEFVYRVLGKQWRVTDRKVLDAGYDAEIKALEPRLEVKTEAFKAILEEVAEVDPRAKKVKPEDLIDRRFLDEMERSGFFDKLWTRG
ncbi:MAG: ABC transporter substrate-binding protein [Deltaproteobacteria bacterium]|nr:ABC transporter substrate-binding protein [Deltaproteobacteria bacterium]